MLLPKDPITVIYEFIRCLLSTASILRLWAEGKRRTKRNISPQRDTKFFLDAFVRGMSGAQRRGGGGLCMATVYFHYGDLRADKMT